MGGRRRAEKKRRKNFVLGPPKKFKCCENYFYIDLEGVKEAVFYYFLNNLL